MVVGGSSSGGRATEVGITCQGLNGLLFLDPDTGPDVEAFLADAAAAAGPGVAVYPPTRGWGKPHW
jgi:hypothetical protein